MNITKMTNLSEYIKREMVYTPRTGRIRRFRELLDLIEEWKTNRLVDPVEAECLRGYLRRVYLTLIELYEDENYLKERGIKYHDES